MLHFISWVTNSTTNRLLTFAKIVRESYYKVKTPTHFLLKTDLSVTLQSLYLQFNKIVADCFFPKWYNILTNKIVGFCKYHRTNNVIEDIQATKSLPIIIFRFVTIIPPTSYPSQKTWNAYHQNYTAWNWNTHDCTFAQLPRFWWYSWNKQEKIHS